MAKSVINKYFVNISILSIEFIKIKVKLIRNIADMKLNINSYILMGKLYFLLN
jgi:hypothetical protein